MGAEFKFHEDEVTIRRERREESREKERERRKQNKAQIEAQAAAEVTATVAVAVVQVYERFDKNASSPEPSATLPSCLLYL